MLRCLILIYMLSICGINGQKLSPCPKIFTYNMNNDQGRWDGKISLHTEEELSEVFVTIVLDHVAVSLGNWFGETITRDGKEFIIRNTDYKLVPGTDVTLKFFVEFKNVEIPSVTTIKLNGQTICSEIKKTRLSPNSTSNISIETTTMPVIRLGTFSSEYRDITNFLPMFRKKRQTLDDLIADVFSETYRNSGTKKTEHTTELSAVSSKRPPLTTDEKLTEIFGNIPEPPKQNKPEKPDQYIFFDTENRKGTEQKCGRPSYVNAIPLILHGDSTAEGEWPWHLAIYRNSIGTSKYICGGSLLSNRFIVTAAHCVTSDIGAPLKPNNFLVYIGTKAINDILPGVQISPISQIRVHPDYNKEDYHNDIAILKTSRKIEYSNLIQPVCLWEGNDDLSDIVGELGTVVGWGFEAKNPSISENLKKTQMPIVGTLQCIYSKVEFFAKYTSLTSFCAGFRNGSGVCNGDSGSGMVMSKPGEDGGNSWYLRGIVSISVPLKDRLLCDPYHYIVFTDAAKYVPWIKKVMQDLN